MKQRKNINIMEGGIKYAGGQGEGSGPMLLVTQFSFKVQEISGLHLRYLCKKTQDQTIFFLVLFFCTKNIQWVLGSKRVDRLRC